MLCAFSSLSGLDSYVRNLHHQAEELQASEEVADIVLFHATVYQEEGEEGETPRVNETHSIYGMAIQKAKVRVMKDWRSLDELRQAFPSISPSHIEKIWRQQHSWPACFQILSSLLSSSSSVLLDNCDFVFEDSNWPSVLEAMQPAVRLSKSDDWTLVHLDGYLSNPSSLSPSPLGDWHLLQASLPLPTPPALPLEGRSYREILLASPSPSFSETPAIISQAPVKTSGWKPRIVIGKIAAVRVDREYGNPNAKEILRLTSKTGALTEEEKEYLRQLQLQEEEDELEWEACCNGKFASQAAVSVKRKASVSHLRPSTYDQKLKRIAMKMK